ncbi:MAG: flagellar export protein FliJ [Oligoflexia bacterium]|nr:flagellar export protein FliJ [Oligoflexia bacterium]
MKKFRFRLEQVLRFRRATRDEKLRILLECRGREHEAQMRLQHLESERGRRLVPEDNVLGVEAYMLSAMYVKRLDLEIERQKELLKKYEAESSEALAQYIEASKEVRSLETLKDRRQREYMERVNYEEAKFLDEIATQKGNTMRAD